MSRTVFMVITSECNKLCSFCYYKQDNFRKKVDKLDFLDFGDLIKNLKRVGFEEITITGGEPLLKKESSLKIIIEANKEKFKINLDTNGTLLNREIQEKLKKIDKFKIYLSGQYISSLGNIFLRKLSSDFSVAIIYVVTKENLNDLEKIIKKAEKYKIELIIQPAYINQSNKDFNILSLKNLNQQERIYFETILERWAGKNKKEAYFDLIRSYYLNDKSKYPNHCHTGVGDIIIDSNGSVFPCFHRQDLKAGNILDDSLDEILIKIKDFSKKIGDASCFDEYCIPLFMR